MADEQDWPRRRDQLDRLDQWTRGDLRNEIDHVVKNLVQGAIARFLTRDEIVDLDNKASSRRFWNIGLPVSDDGERPDSREERIRERVYLLMAEDFPAIVQHVRERIAHDNKGKESEKRVREWIVAVGSIGGAGVVATLATLLAQWLHK